MIDYIALLVALSLSGVSGYYSIVGLAAIFSSVFYPIVFMGCVLEAGKLITASWLYNNWSLAPLILKIYLTFAVVVLMFITSMGIFGFLSKAHIDQTVQLNTGAGDQIQIIDSKIAFEKQSIDNIDRQIAQIDSAVEKYTEKGQASSSLKAAAAQRKTRDDLDAKKQVHIGTVSSLTQQKVKLTTDIRKAEAEVGPIRYIAALKYDDPNADQLEKAVRLVIMILICVFDPLAVVLLIAANVGIKSRRPPKPILIPPVEKHKVFHMNNVWENHGTAIWPEEEAASKTTDSDVAIANSDARASDSKAT